MKSLKDLLQLKESYQFVDLEKCEIAFIKFKEDDYSIWNKLINAVNVYNIRNDESTQDIRFDLQDNKFLQKYKDYDFILININNVIYYMNIQSALDFRIWNTNSGVICLNVSFNWNFYELKSQKIKDRLFLSDKNISLNLKDYPYNGFVDLGEYLEKVNSK